MVMIDRIQETGRTLEDAVWEMYTTTLLLVGWPSGRSVPAQEQCRRLARTMKQALDEAGLKIEGHSWLNESNLVTIKL
jgi:hypothetical protein